MNFIKQNFLFLIIGLLVILLIISRCNQPKPEPQKPTIHIDTVLVTHTDTVPGKPQIVYTKPEIIPPTFIPDTDCIKLRKQYIDLLDLYFRKNVYEDTLKVDSIGFVYVKDTVARNSIKDRTFSYNLKYPIITKTITLPPPSRNQLYIGGSLQGNITNPISQINAGVLLKNKKDQIYGAYAGMNMNGQLQLGISSYWKISFRK
jgi:hypothetical protein